ncbi:hypothetical protein N7462_011458 [Penicillium macrosclerotiorum]|uniref:uncharacterized protein n=1 Tax=Penicillium macrosclerotiorum TaxID=303699 RepID=UPI002546F417|nr:uncharacterized protein N7462_011458 [Penicillium macrosclerotiorum]KAJ5664645.1 hypothetical protein N7462_011458 [Penicillium macrosclerotiorum]
METSPHLLRQVDLTYRASTVPLSSTSLPTASIIEATTSRRDNFNILSSHATRGFIEEPLTIATADNRKSLGQDMPRAGQDWLSKTPSFESRADDDMSPTSSFEVMDGSEVDQITYQGFPSHISSMPCQVPQKIMEYPTDPEHVGPPAIFESTNNPWLPLMMGIHGEQWHTQYLSCGISRWSNSENIANGWPVSDIINDTSLASSNIQECVVRNGIASHFTRYNSTGLSQISISNGSDSGHLYQTPLLGPTFTSNEKPSMAQLDQLTYPTIQDAAAESEVEFRCKMPASLSTVSPESADPQLLADSTSTMNDMDKKNALLLEWKRCGLSYKDIKRIGKFKEAESTLRGRFRTLTKAKEQRVRKPTWQNKDIILLCEAVKAYAETPSTYTPLVHERLLSNTEPPKVSWKKVAQYIWNQGGSYQFGNATCKKKWCEIHDVKI